MWKLLLSALCAAALAQSQDIAGSWQGTLTPQKGKEMRVILKITKEAEELKGAFYSIDLSPQPIAVESITFKDYALRVTMPSIGVIYEGQLNSAVNVADGKMIQGYTRLPLVLKLATPETAWPIIPAGVAAPKPAPAKPSQKPTEK